MIATLKFTLPEEREEFEHALRGGDLLVALSDIRNELRVIRKYEDHGEEYIEAIERAWESFWKVCAECGVSEMI